MQILLLVSLIATLFSLNNSAVAEEFTTPEALRAFGKPGDTVKAPTDKKSKNQSSSKKQRMKKDSPVSLSNSDLIDSQQHQKNNVQEQDAQQHYQSYPVGSRVPDWDLRPEYNASQEQQALKPFYGKLDSEVANSPMSRRLDDEAVKNISLTIAVVILIIIFVLYIYLSCPRDKFTNLFNKQDDTQYKPPYSSTGLISQNSTFDNLTQEALETADIYLHYETLNLSSNATMDEVRERCKELIRQWHPDKHINNPEKHKIAVQKIQDIKEAYEYISNTKKDSPLASTVSMVKGTISNVCSSTTNNLKDKFKQNNSVRIDKGKSWALNTLYFVLSIEFVVFAFATGHADPAERMIQSFVGTILFSIIGCPIAFAAGYFTAKS